MATCRTAAIAAGADPVDRREQVCWKRKVGPSGSWSFEAVSWAGSWCVMFVIGFSM